MTLQQILKDSFNMKEQEFQDSQSLMDLEEWDSMSHMIFITSLEDNYGIELNSSEIMSLVTVGNIKKVLSEKGINEFAA
jgi:acyl carrier protein